MSTLLEPVRTAQDLAGPLGRSVREITPLVGRWVARERRRARAIDAPPSIPRTSFDPCDPATLVDPYRWGAQLREHPLWVNERLNVWIITGYDDLRRAGLDHDVLSSAEGVSLQAMPARIVVSVDRPDHARLRGAVAKLFTREAVAGLEPDIVRMTDEGIDRLVAGDTTDVVEALCAPVPLSALALLLGVPHDRWRDFRDWAQPLTESFAAQSLTDLAWLSARITGRMMRFRRLVEDELERRGEEPLDDVLGTLRRAMDAGDLELVEAYNYAGMLLIAGQETTANLLGSTVAALAQDPELYARLREDRSLLPGAIEEFLRWSSPVQWVTRWTRAPYEVGGQTIPTDARVMLPWMLGNRDPRRFADPDRIDVERDAKAHLGFGSGIHFCLGSHLTRLEARTVLDRFLDRVDRLELASTVRYGTTVSLHGPSQVPVRVVPAC